MTNNSEKEANRKEFREVMNMIVGMEDACIYCMRHIEKYGLSKIAIKDYFDTGNTDDDLHAIIINYLENSIHFSDLVSEIYNSRKGNSNKKPLKKETDEFLNKAKIVVSFEECCRNFAIHMADWGMFFFTELMDEVDPTEDFNQIAEVIIKVSAVVEKDGRHKLAEAFRRTLLNEALEDKKYCEYMNSLRYSPNKLRALLKNVSKS